jgi:uncharacterized protein
MKAVIDTNIVMSRFISPRGNAAQIFERWEYAEFTILTSQPILEEYKAVLFSQKLQRYHRLSAIEMNEVMVKLETQTEYVEVGNSLHGISADPDDDKFLECAIAGGAEYVVSGDHHLLQVEMFQGIEIVPPSAFLAVLELS